MIDEEYIHEVDHYNGIQIQKYNGIFGLLAMQKGGGEQKEVWYKIWTFLSYWKNGEAVPGDKKRPMAVRLGEKQQAIEILEKIIYQIKRM